MPDFVEFSREDARSRREDPMFTLQARGVISINNAAYLALGRPDYVALLYDATEAVVGLRNVDKAHPNAYPVRKQSSSQTFAVAAQGFTAYHGIPTARARRFMARQYDETVWGFALGEGQAVHHRRGTPEAEPLTDRWRHTTNGFDAPALMRLGDVSFSHPTYGTRRAQGTEPPTVRLGTVVACDPLGPSPATSELRARFLQLLSAPAVMDLLGAMRDIDRGYRWTSYGGYGRTNLEATFTGSADTPVGSARLMLPEPGAAQFGRDPRVADLVVEVERTRRDGQVLQPLSIPAWHAFIVQSLGLTTTLVDFLAAELSLNPTNEPPPQTGIWMRAPRAMTELVDIDGLTPIPGTHTSNAFTGYVVADPDGGDPKEAASALLTQMCDYTLHLDAYEPLLASLSKGQRAAVGRTKGRARA